MELTWTTEFLHARLIPSAPANDAERELEAPSKLKSRTLSRCVDSCTIALELLSSRGSVTRGTDLVVGDEHAVALICPSL